MCGCVELSHFQLPVRYAARGAGPERKSIFKVVFVLYGCADKNGLTSFLMNEWTLPPLLDYTCCNWPLWRANAVHRVAQDISSSLILSWLAVLLHTFRNIPD